jgi:hypothetical protein
MDLLQDDDDENEAATNHHSPMDVTSNTASTDFESVASSFMGQSESSVSVSRKSRSRTVVAKTPAQRSNSATVTVRSAFPVSPNPDSFAAGVLCWNLENNIPKVVKCNH